MKAISCDKLRTRGHGGKNLTKHRDILKKHLPGLCNEEGKRGHDSTDCDDQHLLLPNRSSDLEEEENNKAETSVWATPLLKAILIQTGVVEDILSLNDIATALTIAIANRLQSFGFSDRIGSVSKALKKSPFLSNHATENNKYYGFKLKEHDQGQLAVNVYINQLLEPPLLLPPTPARQPALSDQMPAGVSTSRIFLSSADVGRTPGRTRTALSVNTVTCLANMLQRKRAELINLTQEISALEEALHN
jgi:hypothetical protein